MSEDNLTLLDALKSVVEHMEKAEEIKDGSTIDTFCDTVDIPGESGTMEKVRTGWFNFKADIWYRVG